MLCASAEWFRLPPERPEPSVTKSPRRFYDWTWTGHSVLAGVWHEGALYGVLIPANRSQSSIFDAQHEKVTGVGSEALADAIDGFPVTFARLKADPVVTRR